MSSLSDKILFWLSKMSHFSLTDVDYNYLDGRNMPIYHHPQQSIIQMLLMFLKNNVFSSYLHNIHLTLNFTKRCVHISWEKNENKWWLFVIVIYISLHFKCTYSNLKYYTVFHSTGSILKRLYRNEWDNSFWVIINSLRSRLWISNFLNGH